ncbi:MAG: hypothetical protein ACOCZL_01895 [Bacteroidota bacterium]
MKTYRSEIREENILNTNETMNDFSFYFQMIREYKTMDFEMVEDLLKSCEDF